VAVPDTVATTVPSVKKIAEDVNGTVTTGSVIVKNCVIDPNGILKFVVIDMAGPSILAFGSREDSPSHNVVKDRLARWAIRPV
jgi:hypothetical protein